MHQRYTNRQALKRLGHGCGKGEFRYVCAGPRHNTTKVPCLASLFSYYPTTIHPYETLLFLLEGRPLPSPSRKRCGGFQMKRQELAVVLACTRQNGPYGRLNSHWKSTKRIPTWQTWEDGTTRGSKRDPKTRSSTEHQEYLARWPQREKKNGSDQGPLSGVGDPLCVGERTREISVIGKGEPSQANQKLFSWLGCACSEKGNERGRSVYEMLGPSGPSIAYWDFCGAVQSNDRARLSSEILAAV